MSDELMRELFNMIKAIKVVNLILEVMILFN